MNTENVWHYNGTGRTCPKCGSTYVPGHSRRKCRGWYRSKGDDEPVGPYKSAEAATGDHVVREM